MLAACGSAGEQPMDAAVDAFPAPIDLTYLVNPAVYTKGTAITPNTASVSGVVDGFSVTPSLPDGLNFDTSTGTIAGTPTTITPKATYVVTATNAGGSATASLSITVNDVPPANLSYSLNPATYFKDVPIAPNVPSTTGGAVVSYSISANLPTGLTMSPTTGIISGTPSMTSSRARMVAP